MKGGAFSVNSLDTVISGITTASAWIFSLFTDFIEMIQGNSVLFYLVAFSIVAGSIGLVISLIRRFGLKGRRK